MMPCVLFIVARYAASTPSEAIMRAIGLGGDTDTCACMVGALVGSLHGVSFFPPNWVDGLENGEKGRDYALALATQLATLRLTTEVVGAPRRSEEANLAAMADVLAGPSPDGQQLTREALFAAIVGAAP